MTDDELRSRLAVLKAAGVTRFVQHEDGRLELEMVAIVERPRQAMMLEPPKTPEEAVQRMAEGVFGSGPVAPWEQ